MPEAIFDEAVAQLLLRYARMVAARGYVHNTLGNIALRVRHPDFEHGVVYTKHAEVSLEEMTLDNVVVTDIPTGRLLHGTVVTSVGHQLNREILRLRPDVNAVIHVHHDDTIAFFAAGGVKELRLLSIEFPCVMGKPPHLVPSHVNVELDVAPIQGFIANTNAILMESHGVTVLGRSISEAYHRLNTLASEMRRLIEAEHLAALRGTEVRYVDAADVDWMYDNADRIVYPSSGAPRS
ncbi:MAG TPA: class II aldolase/adducin family protein [Methylomirabilota bacterium]|jgi:ribulose-5-phosphate 4-epimerase/fuculose-1-phosphate aldolase|nr:class II aldolase/adducin family protein [Methylomirabilota bacterium]